MKTYRWSCSDPGRGSLQGHHHGHARCVSRVSSAFAMIYSASRVVPISANAADHDHREEQKSDWWEPFGTEGVPPCAQATRQQLRQPVFREMAIHRSGSTAAL